MLGELVYVEIIAKIRCELPVRLTGELPDPDDLTFEAPLDSTAKRYQLEGRATVSLDEILSFSKNLKIFQNFYSSRIWA